MPIGQKNLVDMDKPEGDKSGDKSKSAPRRSATSSDREDRDLRTRLTAVFTRIADAADARGDHELAEVIREDQEVMATGLVSLTRPLLALRAPLVILLSIVEPFMAFSRLVRLMLGRMMVRRHREDPTDPESSYTEPYAH